jgi:hypothetical protein
MAEANRRHIQIHFGLDSLSTIDAVLKTPPNSVVDFEQCVTCTTESVSKSPRRSVTGNAHWNRYLTESAERRIEKYVDSIDDVDVSNLPPKPPVVPRRMYIDMLRRRLMKIAGVAKKPPTV